MQYITNYIITSVIPFREFSVLNLPHCGIPPLMTSVICSYPKMDGAALVIPRTARLSRCFRRAFTDTGLKKRALPLPEGPFSLTSRLTGAVRDY